MPATELIAQIAKLMETEHAVSNWETRDPDNVRGWVGKHIVEAVDHPDGVFLSAPLEDHRNKDDHAIVESDIRYYTSKIAPEHTGNLVVVDNGWVINARWWIGGDDPKPELDAFVAWLKKYV